MLASLFRIAMTSPTRHAGFRRAVLGHVVLVAGLTLLALRSNSLTVLGIAAQVLLVAGIVEGAALIGWRLTQLPKSQALEFVLVSSASPRSIFFAELAVGISRFLFVQLAGFPVLAIAIACGLADWRDLAMLAVMPMIWGIVTGVSLCSWIYEPKTLRRIGEAIALLGVLFYLIVGVLAAENLLQWMQAMPEPCGEWFFNSVTFFKTMNPFGIVHFWFSSDFVEWLAWDRFAGLNLTASLLTVALVFRASSRLVGHFHDRHYSPIDSSRAAQTEFIGDRPLSWWAVRRVMEYSGRVNLYLAGGFCLAYAAYIVSGHTWPAWVGRGAFNLFESWGGPAMLATAMAVMAAVPAAYQFGLWDSTVPDRCRRLELLLLTDLTASDYAHAAFRAAWSRGRGYLGAAALLWIACAINGRISVMDAIAAAFGSLLLWAFAFAVGFRGFATGHQTNGIASLITLGCPMILYAFWTTQQPMLVALVPTSVAFLPMKTGITLEWLAAFAFTGLITTHLLTRGFARCDGDLRKWFDAHQGLRA